MPTIPLFMGGCIRDDAGYLPGTSGEGVEVVISMNVPQAAVTRAMTDTDENTINTLDVLVFLDNGIGQDETFLYSTHATDFAPSGATTTVKVGLQKSNASDKHRLVFLANLRDEVEAVKTSWTPTMTKQQVLQSVTFDAYDAAETLEENRVWDSSQPEPRYLPMWGESEGTYVVTSTLVGSTIGTIKMLRSVATVNIVLNPDTQGDPQGFPDFKLKDIKVYNVPQKGYAAPDPDYITSMVAELPTYSTSFSRNASTVVAYETNSTLQEDIYGFTKQIYIPEAPNTDGDPVNPANIDDLDQTCLVISGYFDGSPKETWYRIDFIDKLSGTENLRWDILRNYRYTFFITSINGAGYETEDQAFKSAPFNIEAEVVYWNEADMEDFVDDGQYYYSLSPMKREHWAAISNGNTLTYKSNYPTWTFEISDNPAPVAGTKPTWLNVTNYTEGAIINGDPAGLEIKYDVAQNSDGVTRTGYIHLKTGRWVITAQIIQHAWSIDRIYVTPLDDVPSAGGIRTITVEGFYDDIDIQAWDVTANQIIYSATIPSNQVSGIYESQNLVIPQLWHPLNSTLPYERTIAFRYWSSEDNDWRLIRTQDQEGYYITSAKVTASNISLNGGNATILIEGNYPNIIIQALTGGTVLASNTIPAGISGSSTVSFSNVNASLNTRTILYGYTHPSNNTWIQLGSHNQAHGGIHVGNNIYVYAQEFGPTQFNNANCPSGWRQPDNTQYDTYLRNYTTVDRTYWAQVSDGAVARTMRRLSSGGFYYELQPVT